MDQNTKENKSETVIAQAVGMLKSLGFVDIAKLATSFGINVYTEPMEDDRNGFIEHIKEDDTFRIVVNSAHSRNRQRFSIAHELAHYLLHKDQVVAHGVVDRDHDNSLSLAEEQEADQLAAELLLPEEYVHKMVAEANQSSEKPLDEPLVTKIADYFQVSKLATILRLREIGYYVPYLAC